MEKELSIRLEAEAVGHISDKKQIKAAHRKKNYAKDGHNSYFSLSKFKTKSLIQICELLEKSKKSLN